MNVTLSDSTRRNWLPFRVGEHGLDVSNTCHEALPIDTVRQWNSTLGGGDNVGSE